MHAIH